MRRERGRVVCCERAANEVCQLSNSVKHLASLGPVGGGRPQLRLLPHAAAEALRVCTSIGHRRDQPRQRAMENGAAPTAHIKTRCSRVQPLGCLQGCGTEIPKVRVAFLSQGKWRLHHP